MYSADPERYNGQMPYRRCGKSGLKLPQISLGCWHNFGHTDDQHEARAILRRAFDRGVTHFDLANNYGPPPGSAEENVGRIMSEDFACHRDELIISSKAGHLMWDGPYGEWGSRKHVLSSLDQSLKRLRLDYVDIFYSHRPDPDTPLEETMGALASAVHQGKTLYVGLSKYPLKMLKKAVAILRDLGIACPIYQPPYSILDRWPENEGIHAWLADHGMGSIVFSPLAQGMLTGKYCDGIPDGSRAARSEGFLQVDQVDAQVKQLRALRDLASEAGTPLHHLALRWVLDQKPVVSALIGARTVAQLDDSLDALGQPPLKKSVIKKIDALAPPARRKKK
ncbi:aldo/keto reductase [Haloferula rosea]|uniref:Aldo/keto reductase n=1 Tax=Haloferula rosea TaxID=490093 RepID=A0A934VF67_9BACT|nr:aldo/keto reductase [Haloferula rosea]MBK1826235.1 aldo/keto reductase [Haloferula rosea]